MTIIDAKKQLQLQQRNSNNKQDSNLSIATKKKTI